MEGFFVKDTVGKFLLPPVGGPAQVRDVPGNLDPGSSYLLQ